jgi:hypothetical protein
VPGASEDGDGFGVPLVSGDFDGDGSADLAVGVSGENGYGTVVVLSGAAGAPLGATGSVVFSERTRGVPGAAEEGDAFGGALAAGDVNSDGRDDLAVGVPGENGDAKPESDRLGEGAVVMLLGSPTGLTSTGSQSWSQASAGVDGKVGGSDRFGATLVVAPLDADRYADLAVGAPFDSVGSVFSAGSVTVLRGGRSGLTTAGFGGTRLHQDTPGVAGRPGFVEFFGYSIAAAAVQSRTQDNLIVGVPMDVVGGEPVGRAHQLAIAPGGPAGVGSRSFHLNTPGLKGRPGGGFGFTVG